MTRLPALLIALCLSSPCLATTWARDRVDDPVMDRANCDVQTPMSSGSYVYRWPSKYDHVFWPIVDEAGIWFCERSGFTAFIGDFDGVTDAEREAIRAYLAEHYTGSADLRTKLALMEGIYALRDKDAAFRNTLLRALARWHQDLGDLEKANDYRRQALAQIRTLLEGELPTAERLEYLYVSCNYEVFLEGADAAGCVARLHAALDANTDEALSGYVDYLRELVEDTPRIRPGGRLDPVDTGA